MIEAAEQRRPAAAGRHHRRADLGQHGHRPGHRRRAQGLPPGVRHARQDVRARRSPCCAPTAPTSWSVPRPCRARVRRATTAWPIAWRARSRAPSSPTSTSTRPIPPPTRPPPAPRSGARPTAASPTSWPAWAPAARSPASAACSSDTTRHVQIVGADPVGSIYSAGDELHAQDLQSRGHRRGLLPSRPWI